MTDHPRSAAPQLTNAAPEAVAFVLQRKSEGHPNFAPGDFSWMDITESRDGYTENENWRVVPLYAHPARGGVDEAMVERACKAAYEDAMQESEHVAETWEIASARREMSDTVADFRSSMRKALQAAALPAVPEGWQPIETAPKDNARLLLLARYNPDTNELQELDFDGIWQSESESWELPQVYWYWASARGIEDPTHWMYQPAAPAQED